MPLFDENQEDKTESPSQFRREEFRRQGTVAVSKDLLSVVGMMAGVSALALMGNRFVDGFQNLIKQLFSVQLFQDFTRADLLTLRVPLMKAWGLMALPILFTIVVLGMLINLVQVGPYITWEPLMPNWERINPVSGLGRLLSGQALIEAPKVALKVILIGVVFYAFLDRELSNVPSMLQLPLKQSLAIALTSLLKLFFTSLGVMLVLAGFDYLYQRYQLEKQMKMTRREAKEEFKLREGDPLIRQRIRNIRRRMASKRMMEAVPKADVIVTNPTHYAVALKYDAKEMVAPKVVAKGADPIALKIREIAKKHGIPIIENKPLARTLYRDLEVGESIPRELYKAVAEVLAYVYRLRDGGYMSAQA